jgi:N-acetylglucosaminyldiphosphoundecaprenol N-acetyl-beta-D-mannosaminyltransferase
MFGIPAPLSLCGIRIDALTIQDLLEMLRNAIDAGPRLILLNHNLHSIYLYETIPEFRDAYSLASYVYIDGIPVVWLGQLAGLPVSPSHRITFLDNFESILSEASQPGWRVFYLGSTREVFDEAMAKLRGQFPSLLISGRDGFFDTTGAQNEEVIAEISEYETDILFIGMGMPRQEKWLAENHLRLNVKAILTSGATLDYVVGHAYKPPAWAGPLGLYGVMRLFSDPTRLWRRYLLEPLILFRYLGFRLLRQRLQKRG